MTTTEPDSYDREPEPLSDRMEAVFLMLVVGLIVLYCVGTFVLTMPAIPN